MVRRKPSKIGFGFKAKALFGAGRVQLAARLSVGFACIPDNIALKTGQLGDQFRQVFDRNFKLEPILTGSELL